MFAMYRDDEIERARRSAALDQRKRDADRRAALERPDEDCAHGDRSFEARFDRVDGVIRWIAGVALLVWVLAGAFGR